MVRIGHTRIQFSANAEKGNSNDIFVNAVSKCIEQIGELCKVLSDEFVKEEPDIPWKSWCRIRDRIAHQYDAIDLEIIWDTVQNDVPILEEKLKQLLGKIELKR